MLISIIGSTVHIVAEAMAIRINFLSKRSESAATWNHVTDTVHTEYCLR